MSTGFNILLSPPLKGSDQPIEFYKKLLAIILRSPNISGDSCDLRIYRRQRPFDYGSDSNDPHIVFQMPPGKGITFQNLFEVIDSVKSDDIYVGASFAYERREWNNENCDSETSHGSLTVEYEAPTFDGGFRNRRLGPYHVLFDNLKYFSHDVIDFSKCPADSPEAIVKLGRYGYNVVVVQNLFKQIAAAIRPVHQVLITEGNRVNPLYFHMVYHNEISGYLFDIQKILQLHTSGGGYFYEGREADFGPPQEGDFDPPYRSLSSDGAAYGDSIRWREEAEELELKLDSHLRLFDGTSIERWAIEEGDVLNAMALANVEPETVNGSLCASSPRFLRGYLDRFYLKLLETINAPIESSVNA